MFSLDLQIKIVLIVKKIQFVSTVKGTFWLFRAFLQTAAWRMVGIPRASRQTADTDQEESVARSEIRSLEATVKSCEAPDCPSMRGLSAEDKNEFASSKTRDSETRNIPY